MIKLNLSQKIGVILIIISLLLAFTDIISIPIRFLTQPLLMGSSKGKDIIFFLIVGLFLLFSELEDNKIISKITWPKFLKKSKSTYLNYILILLLIIGIFGIISEITLRYDLNIGIFTIFNAMKPSMTSTSILHSHIYKSVLGTIINSFLTTIPSGIHTGSSLEPYIPFYSKIFFLLIPIIGLIMLKSVQKQSFYTGIILSIGLSMGLIGVIDGGFFSTPFIGAIYTILILKYNSDHIEYWTGKWFNKKSWVENVNSENVIKKITDYKIILKNAIPHIILLLFILLRFTVAFMGSNPEYYDVTIVNPNDDVNLNDSYKIINVVKTDNNLKYEIDSYYNEMELENSLAKNLTNKCDYYTLSWNTYSYF